MNIVKAQLLVTESDLLGYITYVFKVLEEVVIPFGKNYIMCTRVPNWDHRNIDVGETGFLEYNEVEAGTDSYYNKEQQKFIPYNYTNIYFIKFVKEQDNSKKDIII